ncbi:MAG: hypothetical protein WC712_00685 [Candidatus Brocadiia bacterium]
MVKLKAIANWAASFLSPSTAQGPLWRSHSAGRRRSFVLFRNPWAAEDSIMRAAIMAAVVVVLIEYLVFTYFCAYTYRLPTTHAEAQARHDVAIFCDKQAPVAKRIEALDSFLGWYVPTHSQVSEDDIYSFQISTVGRDAAEPEEIRSAAQGAAKRCWPWLLHYILRSGYRSE